MMDITIRRSLRQSASFLTGWIKDKKLSGPRPGVLGVVTGRLRSSITSLPVKKTANAYIATVGTKVVYGRIHEYGGKAGRGYAAKIPARPFMRPALEDKGNRDAVVKDLKRNIDKRLKK